MARGATLTVLLITLTGCLPRTTVVKDPGPRDRGVRYYRPKPYLFLQPMTTKEGLPVDGMVDLSLVYMPDYDEEYSIHVRSGLGTNNTEISLADGWNLTGLNVDVDSQFDESVRAVGEVLRSVGPVLTAREPDKSPHLAVRATNVPLGLYEGIICSGSDGRKRLYGFRYVGFFPFATCPVQSTGIECRRCYDGQIYGLVFQQGAMVFRPLLETTDEVNLNRLPPATSQLAIGYLVEQASSRAAAEFLAVTGLQVARWGGADTGPNQVTVTLELSPQAAADYATIPPQQQEQWRREVIQRVTDALDTPLDVQLIVMD